MRLPTGVPGYLAAAGVAALAAYRAWRGDARNGLATLLEAAAVAASARSAALAAARHDAARHRGDTRAGVAPFSRPGRPAVTTPHPMGAPP